MTFIRELLLSNLWRANEPDHAKPEPPATAKAAAKAE
jgi:hypothetical protein